MPASYKLPKQFLLFYEKLKWAYVCETLFHTDQEWLEIYNRFIFKRCDLRAQIQSKSILRTCKEIHKLQVWKALSISPIQRQKVFQINWKLLQIDIFDISTFHIIEKLLMHTPFSSLASGGEREKNSVKMAGFPQWAYWSFCSLFSYSALTAIRNFFTKLFKTNWNFPWLAFWWIYVIEGASQTTLTIGREIKHLG